MRKWFRKMTAVLLVVVMMFIMTKIVSTSVGAISAVIENALQWAIGIANDNRHLYVYGGSHGSEGLHYDCSSFVSWALVHAGLDVPISTTDHMRENFKPYGFEWIPWSSIGGTANLKRGDILLNEVEHVEFYLGDNTNVGAHTSKRPAADQISVSGYYNHPWDGVLRYKDEPVITHWYDNYSPADLGMEFYAHIKNKYTGNLFSKEGNDVNGRRPDGEKTQLWRFSKVDDGSYVIRNADNDWCLDVEAGNNIDNLNNQPSGTNVQVYGTYNGTGNQRFYIYNIFDAYYFRPVGMDKVVDMGIDTKLVAVWDYAENFAPQKFDIIRQDFNGYSPENLGENFYAYIHNSKRKQVLTLGNSISSNASDVCGADNSNSTSQIWKFIRLGDGSYCISNLENGWYLDVEAGNNINNISEQPNGTNVQAYSMYNGTDNQRFYIYRMYNSYYIKPVGTNRIVDMGLDNGLVAIWGFGEDFDPQKFDIIRVDVENNLPTSLGQDFYAYIKNIKTQNYLSEKEQITTNANNVRGMSANGTESQIWLFIKNNDGSYTIQNTASKWYLDVDAGNNINNLVAQPNGTNVTTYYQYNGTNNQKFFVYRMYDSYYIKPIGMNRVIDLALSTGEVAVWDYGRDFDPQKFDIIRVDIDNNFPADIGQDFYGFIKNKKTQNLLTEKEQLTPNSNNVSGMPADGTKSQIWHFIRNDDLSYTIQNVESNMYLDVDAGNYINNLIALPNGTNVTTFSKFNGTNNQKFFIYRMFDSYYIKPIGSNRVVDLAQLTGEVAIWDYGQNFDPQKFDILKVDYDNLIIGDTNLDGTVSIRDVTAIQRHLADLKNFTEEQLAVADTNGDGVINITDATHLQKYLAEFNVALGKQS